MSIAFDVRDDERGQQDFASGQESWDRYLANQNTAGLRDRHDGALEKLSQLVPAGGRIFDVGAGAGVFLATANARGFAVGGNEIWPAAVRSCRERTGIDLTFGDDLFALAAESQDAATMWCVLAHADDPDKLLAGIHHLLTRDGVLFFHTPRWCLIDVVALWLMRLTGYRRMFDRRINAMHRVLYSRRGLVQQLRRVGFDVIRVDAVSAYGLRFDVYLRQIGLPRRVATFLGLACNVLVRRGLLPRNTLDVYAHPALGG